MENPPRIFAGKAFRSYTELSLFINEYEAYHRQKFWKRSSRKITSTANIKRHINPELVYYEISYSCIHGGEKFKSRSKGLRKSISFRLGSPCTAYIRLRASPNGQALEIKSFSDQHNHSSIQNRWTVSQVEALIEQYKKYPVLYDTKHEDYDNGTVKNLCVANIVLALQSVRYGVTESDILSQWNNLVIKYVHAQRFRQVPNPTSNEETQFWYLQKLEFLKESVAASIKLEDCVIQDFDEGDIFEPEISTEPQEWANGVADPLASSSGLQIKEEMEDSFPKRRKESEDTSEEDYRSCKDESDIFGEFVAAQLKRITDEDVRQDTIFEIHQVLHKALKKK